MLQAKEKAAAMCFTQANMELYKPQYKNRNNSKKKASVNNYKVVNFLYLNCVKWIESRITARGAMRQML